MAFPRDASALSTIVQALRATSSPAAASFSLVGATIDRSLGGYESAMFWLFIATVTGSPTSFTVDGKLQDSADGSTWADVAADLSINTKVAFTQRTAINTQDWFNTDLSRLRRYVRLVFTVTFVGGTTPTVLLDAKAMLSGGVRQPPAHA